MTDFRFSGGRKTNGPLIHALFFKTKVVTTVHHTYWFFHHASSFCIYLSRFYHTEMRCPCPYINSKRPAKDSKISSGISTEIIKL